jgi:2Fe-2S ferredoxin
MPKIIFLHKDGSQQIIEAAENTSIMHIATQNKVAGIDGICGGSLACATCHVYIHPDWQERVSAADNEKTEEEDDTLDTAFDVRSTSRLGCQIKITNALDGLIIALPGAKTGWS